MHFQAYFLLPYFLQLCLFQSRYVYLGYQSYTTIFVWFLCHCACTNLFFSRDKPLCERLSSPQVGWPISWKRASLASEPTRFQPASYNQNFIVGQISVIGKLYLKIDLPLNEPAPSQPASYNQALTVVLGWKNQNCYLKIFYKVIHINLVKLLEKIIFFLIFWANF